MNSPSKGFQQLSEVTQKLKDQMLGEKSEISLRTIPTINSEKNSGRKQAARVLTFLMICVGCGADAAERHHIDGNPTNNVKRNLVPLCGGCHQLAHGKYPRRSDWSGSAVSWAWRNPYA